LGYAIGFYEQGFPFEQMIHSSWFWCL